MEPNCRKLINTAIKINDLAKSKGLKPFLAINISGHVSNIRIFDTSNNCRNIVDVYYSVHLFNLKQTDMAQKELNEILTELRKNTK